MNQKNDSLNEGFFNKNNNDSDKSISQEEINAVISLAKKIITKYKKLNNCVNFCSPTPVNKYTPSLIQIASTDTIYALGNIYLGDSSSFNSDKRSFKSELEEKIGSENLNIKVHFDDNLLISK